MALLVLLALSAPLTVALKRRAVVVPDQDAGIKPIAEISGLVQEAPRIRLELLPDARPAPKPAPALVAEVASMISLPAPAPDPSFWRVPPPEAAERESSSAARRTPSASKPRRRLSTDSARAKSVDKPKRVAPPLFAKTQDFSDLEFTPPAATRTHLKAPRPLPPSAVEPVAVPDRLDLSLTRDEQSAQAYPTKNAVIVERVPSN